LDRFFFHIEPRRTGEQFDRSNPYVPGAGHGHVPRVITCLGAIGGKDWYLGVAAPGEMVSLDHVAAFLHSR
jgi:hypothetical protein